MIAATAFVLSWLLGAVLLASGVGKLLSPRRFATTVGAVLSMLFEPLAGRVLVLAATTGVIAIELSLAVSLFTGVSPIAVAVVTIALLLAFAAIGAMAARRGTSIACRCFGTSGETLGARTVMRALLLALVAVALLALEVTSDSTWVPEGAEEWISALTLIAGSMLLGLWLSNVDVVIRLAQERRGEDAPKAPSAESEPGAEAAT